MAATRARAIGHDSSRSKETSRLGAHSAEGHADTWKTFTECYVHQDGSGHLDVRREGVTLRIMFGPESEPLRLLPCEDRGKRTATLIEV